MISEPSELAIVGADAPPDALPMLRLVRSTYRPNLVVAAAAASGPTSGATSGDGPNSVPLLADRPAVDGVTTA